MIDYFREIDTEWLLSIREEFAARAEKWVRRNDPMSRATVVEILQNIRLIDESLAARGEYKEESAAETLDINADELNNFLTLFGVDAV